MFHCTSGSGGHHRETKSLAAFVRIVVHPLSKRHIWIALQFKQLFEGGFGPGTRDASFSLTTSV